MSPIVFKANDRISKHYKRRVEQIQSRYEDIRELITHESSKGTRVEKEIRGFLTEFLPEMYVYGSGIVIDNSGIECDRSKQEDILIIDKFFNPKLFIDEEPAIYPVDVIYCGIEVKTSLNESEIHSAVKNIESLKKLKFIKDRVTYFSGASLVGSETCAPRGMIFAFDTTFRSMDTLMNHFENAISGIAKEHRPDMVCILNRGNIGFDKDGKTIMEVFGLLEEDEDGNVTEITTKLSDLFYQVGGCNYPKLLVTNDYFVIDPSRTMLGFLQYLVDSLLKKAIISKTNLLDQYIPEPMKRRLSYKR